MRLFCLILVALPAVAEEPDIAKLLASRAGRERAWGAYHVATRQAKGFQKQLEKLLAETNWRVRATAFDALIRTKASVDWKTLKPHWETNPEAVAILLALHPKKHQKPMLALLSPEDQAREFTRTFRNHLTELRTPGFAAHLMRNLPVTLSVTVCDPGVGVRVGGETGGGFENPLADPGKPPPNWPPVMRHSITTKITTQELSSGHYPTFYLRSRGVRKKRGGEYARLAERFHHIALLAKREIPIRRMHHLMLVNDMAPFLVAKADAAREVIARAFNDTLGHLKKAGVLTPDEAKRLKPKLTIWLNDARKNKKTPLPKLD